MHCFKLHIVTGLSHEINKSNRSDNDNLIYLSLDLWLYYPFSISSVIISQIWPTRKLAGGPGPVRDPLDTTSTIPTAGRIVTSPAPSAIILVLNGRSSPQVA